MGFLFAVLKISTLNRGSKQTGEQASLSSNNIHSLSCTAALETCICGICGALESKPFDLKLLSSFEISL